MKNKPLQIQLQLHMDANAT